MHVLKFLCLKIAAFGFYGESREGVDFKVSLNYFLTSASTASKK